ncbi:hypothetical protein HOLleu_27298 [Holothuria leucospilota]|uniref:MYND-type domain-containing protein n=1 Tax=Holothuria leucospilota TaxID=206669 RepID=A0A9Q1BQ86_HOLLE|nr:hypothetical protein HOLleu_27298 [Holothuria leucospilota]
MHAWCQKCSNNQKDELRSDACERPILRLYARKATPECEILPSTTLYTDCSAVLNFVAFITDCGLLLHNLFSEMGGHHGKHSDSGCTNAAGSSKITTRKDPSKENPRHSAKHDDFTLLTEKKFTVGNKAVKEQFIRDKLIDTSCCTTESLKKTSNETKLRSSVKNEDRTVSHSANDDVINPARAIVDESHGPKEYESVKTCCPVKESSVFGKECCPQTSTVKAPSKEIQYLHYTIKSPRRVTTRPVIGAIDLIKMTHRQFETKCNKNATSVDKDNINATKNETMKDVLCNSVEVRKKENIDKNGKMMSHLKNEAKNTVTLKHKDPQATSKLLVIDNEQVRKYTRNSDVFQNASIEPNLKLPGFKMKETVNKTQATHAEEKLTGEKATPTKKLFFEKMVLPTPVPSKRQEGPHPVERTISMGSETNEILDAHVKEPKEAQGNGVSSKSDEQIPSGTHLQKVGHKNGINLRAVNEKKPQEKLDVSCQIEVRPGSYTQKQTLTDEKDSMLPTKGAVDPLDSLREDSRERVIAQDDREIKSGEETESGGRIDEAKEGPLTELNLEQTGNSKLVSEGNREGNAGEVEKVKEQGVSKSTEMSRKESTDQAQKVTKTKVNGREKTVKGRRRKVKLKPPLDYFKKQGVSSVTIATSEEKSCHSIDCAAPSKPSEHETHDMAKSRLVLETTNNFKEPIRVSEKEEKKSSKNGAKPEQPICQQGKKTIKSPSKVHPPRSPAGDSNSRIVDLNNQKPGVPQELETVSGAIQRQAFNEPEENHGLCQMEDAKEVNFVKNDKPSKTFDKHGTTAVGEDATKMEEASPQNDMRKKETKQGRRKNREKKSNKGDDECDGKSLNIENTGSKRKPVVAENACLAQDVASPERYKTIALPWTETVVPKEKTGITCDKKPKKKKVLVHEKEIRTEDDVIVIRKLRKAVRKGQIPKGQPTLMDIIFCQSCGDTKQPNGQGLFHCPKCKSVFYCTRACQHNDAKRHKKTCTGVKRVYCKHV